MANCPVSLLICSSSVMVNSSGFLSLSLLSSVSSLHPRGIHCFSVCVGG